MKDKSGILKLVIGILIVIGIVFAYLLIKYYYYENMVYKSIDSYNLAVTKYNDKYENLDSTVKLKVKKVNYYIITNPDSFVEQFGNSYKDLLSTLDKMEITVLFNISNLSMIKKNKSSTSNTFSFENEAQIFKEDTTVDKSLFYSIDEIHDIYEESAKKKNELLNDLKSKKK